MIIFYPATATPGTLTSEQQAALTGMEGLPSASNRFVTERVLVVTAENKDTVTLLRGQPLRIHGSGVGVTRANGEGVCTALCGADTVTGSMVPLRAAGVIDRNDWTPITGTPFLTPDAPYFVSETPGMLSATAPTTGNSQVVGRALSPSVMRIAIGDQTDPTIDGGLL